MKAKLTFRDKQYPGLAVLALKIMRYHMEYCCIGHIVGTQLPDGAVVTTFETQDNFWGDAEEDLQEFKDFINDTIEDIKADYRFVKENFAHKFIISKEEEIKSNIRLKDRIYEFEHIDLLLKQFPYGNYKIALTLSETVVKEIKNKDNDVDVYKDVQL